MSSESIPSTENKATEAAVIVKEEPTKQEDIIKEEETNTQTSVKTENAADATADATATVTADATATVVSESDASSSDHESSSIASSSTQEQDEEHEDEEDDALAEVRRSIAKGLSELPTQERIQIAEEVHGIKPMGMSLEEESKPHVRGLFLKQFQDVLDSAMSSSGSDLSADIAAYELCLRKNYLYATNESGELRLMCLRAELWNPAKACERFLKHLSALYKYYGEDGLKQPLNIDYLDYHERNRPSASSEKGAMRRRNSSEKKGIYKKGKGGSKRKGSLDSLPDMLALKSGSIQVLPSRDRSGRRVVVLQPVPSVATAQQTQLQVQHSKVRYCLDRTCSVSTRLMIRNSLCTRFLSL